MAVDWIRQISQLQATLGKMELALGSILEGIVLTDEEARVQWCNAAFDRLAGKPHLEILGADAADVLPLSLQGREVPAAEHPARVLLKSKTPVNGIYELLREGQKTVVEISGAPSGVGRQKHVILALRDITERKRLEAQFLQSQKMEAVGRLSGGIAHDFSNLLTAILGFGHMVQDSLKPKDPRRKDMEEILKAARQAGALTQQLTALSRRQTAAPKVLDMNTLIKNMEKLLRRLIGEDIELAIILKPDLDRIKSNPGQIDQIILNLAVNARDAMPKGGKLTIETSDVELNESSAQTHIDAHPGPYVLVSVSDTGTGMDASTKAHLFEPFFTTKKTGKGTGLGLSTVYGIVKQNKGFILVHSEVKLGTIFKIYLPRIDETLDRARPVPKPHLQRGIETILLAEDEQSIRKMARRTLEGNGYTVLEASGSREAVAFCGRHSGPIHLLLTDVVMPKMDGRELASRLKRLRPETKVLFMTGYTEAKLPLPRLLQKPFTPESLLRKVREVLDHE